MDSLLPVSVIIPTRNRLAVLNRTIGSLLDQTRWPAEVIIIDGSTEDHLHEINRPEFSDKKINLIYRKAIVLGAARQRMQGIALARYPVIWFLDDDVLLDPECTRRLWEGLTWQDNVGAVNAMIKNQRYTKPGFVTRSMYHLLHGKSLRTYAGKVIGPAWNLLPEDEPGLPDYVTCEWLNTTCTLYKKEVLPDPVFPDFFFGYSLMEDVALSIRVAKKHILLNARTARIFHDSQPGDHKDKLAHLSQMELVNRHYVMTTVLEKNKMMDYVKLFIFELFGLASGLQSWRGIKNTPQLIWGKVKGIKQLTGK